MATRRRECRTIYIVRPFIYYIYHSPGVDRLIYSRHQAGPPPYTPGKSLSQSEICFLSHGTRIEKFYFNLVGQKGLPWKKNLEKLQQNYEFKNIVYAFLSSLVTSGKIGSLFYPFYCRHIDFSVHNLLYCRHEPH